MKITRFRFAALATLLGAGLTAAFLAGCQNPFDPQADLRLLRWDNLNGGNVILITQSEANSNHKSPGDDSHNRIVAEIANYSSVPVTLTSYTVVYRQIGEQGAPCSLPPGNAICVLGGAAGRRFQMLQHIGGLTSYGSGYSLTDVQIRPITDEVLSRIFFDSNTINGGIDMEILLYGTDHNGHDVKVGGSIHIEIF